MARFIDDETETPNLIVRGRHQKSALPGVRIALAATGGDHLGHAGMMIGSQGRDNHPLVGMCQLEGLEIPRMGFAWCQHLPENRLPRIRLPVLQCLFRNAPLVCGEQVGKGDGDSCLAAIFLIKPVA